MFGGPMGLRGYVLVKLHEPLDSKSLWKLTEEFESIEGIEFASNMIGVYDFVLSVDTKESLESIVERVRGLNPAGETVGLKTNDIFDKHREILDLKIFDELANY
jgi:hypothetical protein